MPVHMGRVSSQVLHTLLIPQILRGSTMESEARSEIATSVCLLQEAKHREKTAYKKFAKPTRSGVSLSLSIMMIVER